jgi:predicted ArsR family transcriptional regulator
MQDDSRTRFPEDIASGGRRRETARQEFSARARILDLLREKGPLTVPEVARALGLSTHEANWWLMGFVRYNKVRASEKADDGGYFRYSLIEAK